jgi:phage N-6-adenine-methyltransferase
MSLVGFAAKNHPQQGIKDDVDDRGTPPDLFAWCEERFGAFTVDVAASPKNAKCPRFYTRDDDGLSQNWDGERVWCNPPFSKLEPWARKAWDSKADVVVMLLPANRTEQPWWQEHIESHRDRGGRLTTIFLPGRRRFIMPGDTEVKPNNRPPFGIVLAVWSKA